MTNDQSLLRSPPWQVNHEGEPRRVGVEVEMNHIRIDAVARQVADCLELTMESPGRYERKLVGDPAGEWVVELDSRFIKELGRQQRDAGRFADDMATSAEEALAWLADDVVPVELVSPPLPLDRLPEFEHIIVLLRQAGARGTSDAFINAFGMQFNPEIASADTDHVTAILKAFLCCYDWLCKRADIDLARKVSTYVSPFPADYVRQVVAPDYWPERAALIDDYLARNPTRNRALDLLPLFAWLDPERVARVTDDPLIKPRPTFHYRLPDSNIDQSDWGLHVAWNDWVEVEWLAYDRDRLDACCAAYQQFLERPFERWFGDWARQMDDAWLDR